MQIVNLTCPCCGAQLVVDSDFDRASCEYCGATFPIEGAQQTLGVSDAEQAGYDFERGRMRAQQEQELRNGGAQPAFVPAVQQQADYDAQPVPEQPKRKRRLWLWVLGWLLMFPIPVTIIMTRNERVKSSLSVTARYFITAAAWILYLLIGFFGPTSDEAVSAASHSSATPIVASAPASSGLASTTAASSASSSSASA